MELIGYQFINSDGYPVGYLQPSLNDAWDVAEPYKAGKFYRVVKDRNGKVHVLHDSNKSGLISRVF